MADFVNQVSIPILAKDPPTDRLSERVVEAVQRLNRAETGYPKHGINTTFEYDPATHREIVTVVDRASKQVLYQIPAREVLKLAAELRRQSAR